MVKAVDSAKRIREDERHSRADMEWIEAYRKDRIEADSARQAFDDLKRVLDEHDKHLARARTARERIAAVYADLDGAPEDIEARIETVLKLEESRRTLIEAAAAPYVDSSEQTSEEDQRARLQAERGSSREALSRLDRWTHVPLAEGQTRPEPSLWLAKIRAITERFQSAVRRFVEIDGQHREALLQRETFAPIAVLPEDAQEKLAHLDAAREERARAVKIASTFREEVASRRQEFEERYASLQGFDLPRFLSILEGRAGQYRRLRELNEEAKDMQAIPRLPPPWAAVGTRAPDRHAGRGARRSDPALAADLQPALAAVVFALLVGLALLAFTAPSAQVRETRVRLRANERETGDIRERLRGEFIPSGPWLPDDEFAFDRARTLVANRDADAAAIERSGKAILDAEGISTGQEMPSIDGPEIDDTEFDIEEHMPGSLVARIAVLDQLEEKAKEIAEACGMPAPDAVREYRKLSARLHAIDGQREDALREILGADTDPRTLQGDVGREPMAPGSPPGDPRNECRLAAWRDWSESRDMGFEGSDGDACRVASRRMGSPQGGGRPAGPEGEHLARVVRRALVDSSEAMDGMGGRGAHLLHRARPVDEDRGIDRCDRLRRACAGRGAQPSRRRPIEDLKRRRQEAS